MVLLWKQILSHNNFYRLKLISQKGGSMWQPRKVSSVAQRDLKLRMLPFCPMSFYWQLFLAPAVLPWDCLKGSLGGSSDWNSVLVGFILGWLMLLRASLQGKGWFTSPWTAREDFESYKLNCLLLVELWKGPYSTTLFPFPSCRGMPLTRKFVTENRSLLCKHCGAEP